MNKRELSCFLDVFRYRGISCLEIRVERGAGMEIVFCVSLASQLATQGEGAGARVEASQVLCSRRYIYLQSKGA